MVCAIGLWQPTLGVTGYGRDFFSSVRAVNEDDTETIFGALPGCAEFVPRGTADIGCLIGIILCLVSLRAATVLRVQHGVLALYVLPAVGVLTQLCEPLLRGFSWAIA